MMIKQDLHLSDAALARSSKHYTVYGPRLVFSIVQSGGHKFFVHSKVTQSLVLGF